MSKILDITKETCPMTFVKVKLALSRMAAGEQLVVHLKEGEPLNNVPASCEEQGYHVEALRALGDGVHELIVRK